MTFDEGLAVGLVIGRKNPGGTGRHPDRIIYTDSDPDYSSPAAQTGETFDTVTEVWEKEHITRIWGIGVSDKGGNNETVTRLVYPDYSYVTLVNW